MDLRFEDHQRAGRAVIAVLDRDELALRVALDDVLHDSAPNAAAGMLLGVVHLASEVLAASVGDATTAADILRASLGSLTAREIEKGDANE